MEMVAEISPEKCRKKAILVTADVVGLYRTIPHQADLEAL